MLFQKAREIKTFWPYIYQFCGVVSHRENLNKVVWNFHFTYFFIYFEILSYYGIVLNKLNGKTCHSVTFLSHFRLKDQNFPRVYFLKKTKNKKKTEAAVNFMYKTMQYFDVVHICLMILNWIRTRQRSNIVKFLIN